MTPFARIDRQTGTIEFRIREWGEEFPISALDRKIALYTRLRDRKGGRYAKHYAATVGELLRVQRALAKRPVEGVAA